MIGTALRSGPPDNRAVSDVLAFILVFSIIITSVGLVYVFGMGALGDAQVNEQNRNAERAFETLSVSFNDLQTGRGEERLSQLNPRGGRVSVDDSPTINVTDAGGDNLFTSDAGSLNYAHEGTTVSYELGAVFRADDGHSVMVRQPEFVCTDGTDSGRAVVSYPTMSASQPSSVSTSSTLRIRATKTGTDVNRSTAGNVTIEISESTHADAWARYFDSDSNGWGLDSDADPVKATCDVDNAYVRETGVDVDLL